ncbi:MAG: PspC domain-containing protein [Cyclobacteriaceae bacterium]
MVKRLTRSRNSILGGVCAGIAEYLNVDPLVVRLLYVALSVVSVGFPGILVYAILWIVIPEG